MYNILTLQILLLQLYPAGICVPVRKYLYVPCLLIDKERERERKKEEKEIKGEEGKGRA